MLLGADQTGAVSVIGHPAAVIVSRELAARRLQPAPANQGQFANIPQHFSNQGTATFEPFQTFSFYFFQVTTYPVWSSPSCKHILLVLQNEKVVLRRLNNCQLF